MNIMALKTESRGRIILYSNSYMPSHGQEVRWKEEGSVWANGFWCAIWMALW